MSTKSIIINEDHFKIKKQNKTPKKQLGTIKFKKPLKNKTVSRDKILNFIRQQQNKKPATNGDDRGETTQNISTVGDGVFNETLNFFNQLKDNNAPIPTQVIAPTNNVVSTASRFRNIPFSVSSFSKRTIASPATDEVVHSLANNTIKSNNYTLKTYPSTNNQLFEPKLFDVMSAILPPIQLAPVPLYGVLKNGKLPTYRQHMQRLQSLFPQKPTHTELIHQNNGVSETTHNKPRNGNNNHNNIPPSTSSTDKKVKLEFKKQKKTIRRTFRVGRSKHQHNIGVIINNKTIRNECSTKKHLLKQTSINDVKQFLLKKGLIKIGTTAPNDVLRKMYETANLICGDVHNHNSDILLHNYFNNA
jgi:hypothetical protein